MLDCIHRFTCALLSPISRVLENLIVSEPVKNILAFCGKPGVHYPVHRRPPVLPVLIQMKPVHTLPTSFFKIHFNVSFPSLPRSSKCSDE